MEIKLRPLVESDALTSYKWRNNPKVWEFTGNRPNREITPEIETEWIKNVLNRKNERRYAILADEKYIGNAYLTDMTETDAEFHIFIGDTEYWGKGVATATLKQIAGIAKNELKLKRIVVEARKDNISVINVNKKCGFVETSFNPETNFCQMELVL